MLNSDAAVGGLARGALLRVVYSIDIGSEKRRAKKKKQKSHVCPWYNDIPSIFDIMPGSNPRPVCIIEKKTTIDLSPDPCNATIALYSNPIPKMKE